MFEQKRLATRCAVIALVFLTGGYVQANDGNNANRNILDVHSEPNIMDGGKFVTTNSASLKVSVDDYSEIIEEIVVIGRSRRPVSKLDNITSSIFPLEKPSRINLQFLPLYDPKHADRDFYSVHSVNENRRAGDIQLFRLSFGRIR